jgi:DNA-binding transcriptional MerR regulator
MPYKEKDQDDLKLYYSIGEVAARFEVNPSLIRFWEKEFEIIRPKKNKKGNRLFTREDVNNFATIFHLVKERGFTLDGAKKKLREVEENQEKQGEIPNDHAQIADRLIMLKGQLEVMRKSLGD